MNRSLYNASFRVVLTFLLACFVALAATVTATAGGPIEVVASPTKVNR